MTVGHREIFGSEYRKKKERKTEHQGCFVTGVGGDVFI